MNTRSKFLVFCLLLLSSFLCVSLPASAQTDPFSIRVESNLVLIHTEVYNTHSTNTPAFRQCRTDNGNIFDGLPFSKPFTPKDCYYDIVIHGLEASDFHVFEDGVEQKIESVEYELEAVMDSRDNLGFHGEWSHTPRGKWRTIDLGTQWLAAPSIHYYRLAYIPSDPEEGKCHKIRVTVDRHDSDVYSTDQYCYTTNLATDPLNGTKYGRQMETALTSNKRARIPLVMEASFFYSSSQMARVDIVLEFPWKQLEHQFTLRDMRASIGVLGVAYKKDRTVATRFTDFGCCASGTRWFANPLVEAGNLPSYYETQIDLPVGEEYDLRVVLSDGDNFGRADIPLKIDSYDGKQLAISSVVLSNRFRDASVAAQESSAVNLAPGYVPLVSRGLQFTPASQTTFKSKDHLTAYFEIYEPLLAEQPKTAVQAHVRIVDGQTGKLRFQFAPIDAASFKQAGSTVLAVAGDLPIAQLPKGDYRLEVQATDSDGRSTPVRSANFTIE
jgi:hypothetical protein